jgi:hypothetical protein
VRSRISTSASTSEARGQLAHALHGVVEDLDVMAFEQRKAGQLAHGVLVIVENGNLHW